MIKVDRVSVEKGVEPPIEKGSDAVARTLREVKSYMSFWGWTHDGGPGAVKLDANKKPIAYHGDATWIADIEKASDTIARLEERATTQRGFGGGSGRRLAEPDK